MTEFLLGGLGDGSWGLGAGGWGLGVGLWIGSSWIEYWDWVLGLWDWHVLGPMLHGAPWLGFAGGIV